MRVHAYTNYMEKRDPFVYSGSPQTSQSDPPCEFSNVQ